MDADQADIAAANAGEDKAFERLYFRHRDWVYRLARRYGANHDDALDILQEIFAYFMKKFPGFTLTASVRTFLFPAVKHLTLRTHEKARRLTYSEDPPETEAQPAPPDPQQLKTELAQVLGGLSVAQREIVLLRFVDDFSLNEIAAALEIPLGTVKSYLHRALSSLRENPATRKYFLE